MIESILDKKNYFLKVICPNSMCGSQRCDGSDEWLEGCDLFKEFIESENKERNNAERN